MPALSGLSGLALTDDNDLVFSWDMQITGADGVSEVAMRGQFILRAGVTQ